MIRAGVYQHCKGKNYLVLGTARHSETGETLVVYVPLYDVSGPQMAVRPIEMFEETIVGLDGLAVPRFRYVGDGTEAR